MCVKAHLLLVLLLVPCLLSGFGIDKLQFILGGGGVFGEWIDFEKEIGDSIPIIFSDGYTTTLKLSHYLLNAGIRNELMVDDYMGLSFEYKFQDIIQTTDYDPQYKSIRSSLFNLHVLLIGINAHLFRYNYDPYIFVEGGYGFGTHHPLAVASQIPDSSGGYPIQISSQRIGGLNFGGGLGFVYWPRFSRTRFLRSFFIDFRLKYLLGYYELKTINQVTLDIGLGILLIRR